MKIIFQFFISFFLSTLTAHSQDLSLYNKQLFIRNGDTLPYRIMLPENYDYKKKYPLVYFLHGRGESGTDNEKSLVHGGKLFAADSNRKNFPAIVVFPQCPVSSYWSDVNIIADEKGKRTFTFSPDGEPTKAMSLALKLLDKILAQYPIRKNQIYVAGLSMGGMGTYEIVRRRPKIFAAAIAICGGASPLTAPKMKRTAWWIFHGEKDDIVDPQFSKDMAAALKAAGADVTLTLYPKANHNSWDSAFAEPGLLPWLFSKKKK